MRRILGVAAALLALGGCRDPDGPTAAFRAESEAAFARLVPPGTRGGPAVFTASKSSGVASAVRFLEDDRPWADFANLLAARCGQGWGAAHRDERALTCTRQEHHEVWTVSATPVAASPLRVRVEFTVRPE